MHRGADEGGDAVPIPGAEPAAAATVQGRTRPQHHPASAAGDAAQPVRRPKRPSRHAQGRAALVPDQEAAAVPDPNHAALFQEQLDAREEPNHYQLPHQERRPERMYAAREPKAEVLNDADAPKFDSYVCRYGAQIWTRASRSTATPSHWRRGTTCWPISRTRVFLARARACTRSTCSTK